MKLFVLAILLLVSSSVASSQTDSANFGNYTIEFDLQKPHEIVDNTDPRTVSEIRTFVGTIFLIPIPGSSNHAEQYLDSISVANESGAIYYSVVYAVYFKNYTILSNMRLLDTIDFLKNIKEIKARQ